MELSFRTIEMKFIIPLFTGVLCSLIVCLFIGLSFGHFKNTTPAITINYEEEDISLLFAPTEVIPDAVLEYFRNPEYRDWVIDFFAGLCSSQEIAYAILDSSDEFNVPPALSFALCWEESRFNPNAINRQNRNGSIDRGLFQLNSQSFPHLDVSVFYSINSNARYGVGYLNQCLSWGGSEISALAMYNAGAGRVRSTGAPEITLNYISRILENRRKIESRFHSRLIKEEEMRLNERSMNAAAGGLFGRAF